MTEIVATKARYRPNDPNAGRADRSGLSTQWTAIADRGLEALDFEVSQYPGEPMQLHALHARPPTDAQGYQAMVAASQFSAVLWLLDGHERYPDTGEARRLQREVLETSPCQRAATINHYRTALGMAFKRFLARAEVEGLAEMTQWYESTIKAVDG
ncbi:MAG: hypothetical protein BGN86_12425 [Caulobacterales bacterium 68-7]|nr:MAG: hypothetical protein BGN86_12425 [Caulobacterales bacterium 68-7]